MLYKLEQKRYSRLSYAYEVVSVCIISDDHSRVVLTPYPHDPHSDYINANYIDVSLNFLRKQIGLIVTSRTQGLSLI